MTYHQQVSLTALLKVGIPGNHIITQKQLKHETQREYGIGIPSKYVTLQSSASAFYCKIINLNYYIRCDTVTAVTAPIQRSIKTFGISILLQAITSDKCMELPIHNVHWAVALCWLRHDS